MDDVILLAAKFAELSAQQQTSIYYADSEWAMGRASGLSAAYKEMSTELLMLITKEKENIMDAKKIQWEIMLEWGSEKAAAYLSGALGVDFHKVLAVLNEEREED